MRIPENPSLRRFARAIRNRDVGNRSIWAACLPKSLDGLDEADHSLRTVGVLRWYNHFAQEFGNQSSKPRV